MSQKAQDRGLAVMSKQNAFTIIFLGISVLSAISLVNATLNYVEFYTAIERLELTVINVSTSIGQTKVNVTLFFQITNPTTYMGLKLQELSYILKFEANDETVDICWDLTAYREPIPVNPVSNMTFQYTIDLNIDKDTTRYLMQHYETHQGNIKWLLKCGAVVSTFLGKFEVPLTATFEEH